MIDKRYTILVKEISVDMFLIILFLIIGFVLIIKGGDLFVDSAIWLAKRTGIPNIVIGATIVSIGTTIPEVLVSVISVIKGLSHPEQLQAFSEIAINNSVGSMLCNIALILAFVLVIKPPKTEGRSFVEKAIALLLILGLLIVFVMTGNTLSVVEGVILLILFFAFMYLNYNDAKRDLIKNKDSCHVSDAREEAKKQNSFTMIALFVVGAAAIAIGAYLLVDNGEKMAKMLGVPAQIIGVTVLAIGTSLPELITSITALRKGNCEMGLGNIIGANVINSTLLLGLVAVISGIGIPVDTFTRTYSFWILLAITLVLCIPAIIKSKTMKWQGWVLLAMYLGFVTFNIVYVIYA